MELPKRYDPKEAEPRWQNFWADNDIFEFHPNANKEPYTIDTPPPTVSGKMHMGHAFSYTQQDIVARFQRMRGKNVFFPFGTDDNGLPTEKLVEKKKNIRSAHMTREEFVKICNEVIEEDKPKFIQSWKDIGMSADFKRSYSTISKHCQITSQASFIDLHNKERIYQQESPNTFCVTCQTAIAQAEFESVEKSSHFNDIAFKTGGQNLIISTTRPELIPACVALFYHPDDDKYQHLKNKFAKVPLFNYEVPILSDESVDKDKGTGLMMVCTFGDKDDVEKWHKYNLPLRVVFEKNGRMNELAGEFKGMKIREARVAILDHLKKSGVLINQKEITHAVNVHDRCKTEIEFLKTPQWYIKVLDKKQELLEAANDITWYPKHMKVRYDHWVQNLNWDWCISRQRHFGISIPVWKCKKCGKHILPNISDLPVDPTIDKPKKKCECSSNEFEGETDVLDTWATSSVTPEIVKNWIHKGEYDFTYIDGAMSLRPQAHDIIRTWLFYTVVKSIFHFGRVPWKNVMISGHAQDPKGRKMSKSLGNVVEPLKMIEKYSADALRFWAAGSKLGDDLPFQEKDLLTGQKFSNKLWNASKFTIMHLKDFKSPLISQKSQGDFLGHLENYKEEEITEVLKDEVSEVQKAELFCVFDKWLLSKLNKIIQESTETFEKYEYSRTKAEVEKFFWHTFCDQYLEIVKDRLYNPDVRGDEVRKSAQNTLHKTLLDVLKMMAPIMPHITEEIYQLHFADKEGMKSIHLSSWPEFSSELINEKAELTGDLGVDIINTVRKFKSENQLSLKEELSKLVLVSDEEGFREMIISIKKDLRSVLKVKEIVFEGQTSLESDHFSIKIGISR